MRWVGIEVKDAQGNRTDWVSLDSVWRPDDGTHTCLTLALRDGGLLMVYYQI